MSATTRRRTAATVTTKESPRSVKSAKAKPRKSSEVEKVESALRAHEKTPQAFYSVAQVTEALKAAAGIKSAAAKKLGCAPSTLSGYFDRHPELHDVLTEIENGLLDLAEGKLIGHIQRGSLDALKFYLSTKGKNRGYTKRVENTGKDGKPLLPPEALRIEFVRPA